MSLVPNTITQMIRNFSRNKVICLKMDIRHSFYRVSVYPFEVVVASPITPKNGDELDETLSFKLQGV